MKYRIVVIAAITAVLLLILYLSGNKSDSNYFTQDKAIAISTNTAIVNPPVPEAQFVFLINGKIMKLGDEEKDVDLKKIFGEPLQDEIVKKAQKEPFGAYDHLSKRVVTYKDLEIDYYSDTTQEADAWSIGRISVSNPEFKTLAGIGIGDKLERVKSVYSGLVERNNAASKVKLFTRMHVDEKGNREFTFGLVEDDCGAELWLKFYFEDDEVLNIELSGGGC